MVPQAFKGQGARLVGRFALVWSLIALLSGCMYQEQALQQAPMSYAESVDRVQRALDRFQSEQGILPIYTAGPETPRYEKFRIDLGKMKQMGFLDEIPKAAFEEGGGVYFLVINEEIDPMVKVLDLVTVQKVNDVQRRVDLFRSSHGGKLPGQGGAETYSGLFKVDLSQIQAKDNEQTSVYSGQSLPYLMDAQGKVYVDYAFDIMQIIDQSKTTPKQDMDLRELLIEYSAYVPVKSLPYHYIDGAPVPMLD
ncbi:hypothetical protein ACFQ3W_08510 [Paenibacillus puldeungensis]|uniref:Lipoprotein n=1 Tax=Paenibacillus puldeungensis TaxID=696536 RepID=A0ABW3RW44_9BACL